MADNYWIGLASAVAQVTSVQITAYDATTTYKLTVGGVTVSTLGTGGTVNATATALAAAWNVSSHPYFTGITAVAATDTVTLTADVAGVPFVVSRSVSGGTGTMGAVTAVTASSGPNHWDTDANWSLGVAPVNGDNVWIRNTGVPILFGLDQSAVAPALVAIDQSYIGQIGLPYAKYTKSRGSYDTSVPEYRADYLKIAATAWRVGENFGTTQASGPTLLKLNSHTANAQFLVFATGTSQDNLPPCLLKINHASATLKMYGGSKVGLGWELPTDTGQVAEVDVYAGAGFSGSPEFYVGGGIVQGNHLQETGIGVLRNWPTTLKVESAARVTLAGAAGGTITTLEKRGEFLMATTGTVTNLKG